MPEIKLDYSTVTGIATKMKQHADGFATNQSTLNAQVQKLNNSWTGSAGEAMKNELSEMKQYATKLQEAMQELAKFAKQAADALKQTDEGVKQSSLNAFKEKILNPKNWNSTTTSKGKGIDVDGAYGAQCADISKMWAQELLGLKSPPLLSAWNNAGTKPMVNFDWKGLGLKDVSGKTCAPGDIGFTITPTSGHTFVILSAPNAQGKVLILEQNSRYTGSDGVPNTDGHPQTRWIDAKDITNAYRKP